jgi:hypothetical protein
MLVRIRQKMECSWAVEEELVVVWAMQPEALSADAFS